METNVELYVKSKDRWLIDATFPGHQEPVAVEDAKQLASQRHVQAVKVIRETIDPATGTKLEKTVFTTEPEKSSKNYDESSNQKEDDSDQKNWMDDIPEENPEQEKPEIEKSIKKKIKVSKKSSEDTNKAFKSSLAIKILSILVFSSAFAGVVTLIFQKFGLNLYNQFGV